MTIQQSTQVQNKSLALQTIDLLMSDPSFSDFKTLFKTPKAFNKFVSSFRLVTATNPEIMQDAAHPEHKKALFSSLYKAAHDGLIIDGQRAALVLFNSKIKSGGVEKWVKIPQYMPMIKGIREKIFEFTGMLIEDQIVYANDTFEWEQGDNPKLIHKPTLNAELGQPIAVYAVARKDNLVVDRCVMRIAEVDKIMRSSKSGVDKATGKPAGIWRDWWEEMAKKTVVRRLAKQLPLVDEIDEIIARDNVLYDVILPTNLDEKQRLYGVTTSIEQAKPRPTLAQAIEAQTTTQVTTQLPDDELAIDPELEAQTAAYYGDK